MPVALKKKEVLLPAVVSKYPHEILAERDKFVDFRLRLIPTNVNLAHSFLTLSIRPCLYPISLQLALHRILRYRTPGQQGSCTRLHLSQREITRRL